MTSCTLLCLSPLLGLFAARLLTREGTQGSAGVGLGVRVGVGVTREGLPWLPYPYP